MVFHKESDLEEVAKPFLNNNFRNYIWQVPFFNKVIDLVAIDNQNNLVGIEFKLKDWKKALKQAITNSNAFDYLYVCVPGGKYTLSLIEKANELGIGVMIYNSEVNTIRIIHAAEKINRQWLPNKNFLINYVKERNIV